MEKQIIGNYFHNFQKIVFLFQACNSSVTLSDPAHVSHHPGPALESFDPDPAPVCDPALLSCDPGPVLNFCDPVLISCNRHPAFVSCDPALDSCDPDPALH